MFKQIEIATYETLEYLIEKLEIIKYPFDKGPGGKGG